MHTQSVTAIGRKNGAQAFFFQNTRTYTHTHEDGIWNFLSSLLLTLASLNRPYTYMLVRILGRPCSLLCLCDKFSDGQLIYVAVFFHKYMFLTRYI